MSRRKARIIAFQALYSWDVNKAPLEDLMNFTWLEKSAADVEESEGEEVAEAVETAETEDTSVTEEQTFAKLIIAGTIDHIDEIDEKIKAHLSSTWTFERINRVSLAILRTSIYELCFVEEAVPGIVIDEAVTISKSYGTDDSFKFVNAVLDKIGKNENK
ncbi:MAG: transcription antitermination factor NusB [Treponema sp.]|nr:transcription antitermination factor NusB [Treponema sp.]